MFNFEYILEDLKNVNKNRYYFYKTLLDKKITSQEFLTYLNILSDEKIKDEIFLLSEEEFYGIRKFIQDFINKNDESGISYGIEKINMMIFDLLKTNHRYLSEKLREVISIVDFDLLAFLLIMENFKEFPEFIYDIGLLSTKFKTFQNLTYEEVNILFNFLKENANKITGIKASEFYIPLYDVLSKIDSQYDVITYKGLLVDCFENILNTSNMAHCALYNNVSSMMIGVENGFYSKEELIKNLSENNFSVFINYLVLNNLYTLNDLEENFADTMFLKWLMNEDISNILNVLNNVETDLLNSNLKLQIAQFIYNLNDLDYYLIFVKDDLNNENFKQELLTIIKNKDLKFFENKINNFCNCLKFKI